jgi:hypothetical protein
MALKEWLIPFYIPTACERCRQQVVVHLMLPRGVDIPPVRAWCPPCAAGPIIVETTPKA